VPEVSHSRQVYHDERLSLLDDKNKRAKVFLKIPLHSTAACFPSAVSKTTDCLCTQKYNN
jgi:hypothetical protein